MNNDVIEDHSRTIIHIDLDCFYAQVEMIKNPALCTLPLGIQQKNIVVTSNYVAREHGVTKCMSISDALKVCPNLVLVKGEDLYDYRKVSYKITAYLQRYSSLVERLGLDENYVDVTNLTNDRLQALRQDLQIQGHIFGQGSGEICQCGCAERLKLGSVIAQEIRDGIKTEFNLTSCAGIAHNKLLAKLVGSVHKPNQQTTIFPNSALELMLSLKMVSSIPGVGFAMAENLEGFNIKTMEELHNCRFETLKMAVTVDKAQWLLNLSYGRDSTPVKPSGKPQSIGLEDSCKSISVEAEIREKFQQLLTRLMILVAEDGRIPTTIKVTIRKFDNVNKISHRETRQCNISPSLFTSEKLTNAITVSEQAESKLLSIVMHLFAKLVNISQSYHITLLGLSFTKFQERVSGRNSIASYFVKNVAVQSVTSIEKTQNLQNSPVNLPTTSQTVFNADGSSETEMEPSPKKTKFASLIARRNCFSDPEYSSPSKLRVAELRINCRDGDQVEGGNLESTKNGNCSSHSMDTNQNVQCPPNADEEVFRQLPLNVQQELWDEWKRERAGDDTTGKSVKKAKTNTILNYFVKN